MALFSVHRALLTLCVVSQLYSLYGILLLVFLTCEYMALLSAHRALLSAYTACLALLSAYRALLTLLVVSPALFAERHSAPCPIDI